MRVIRPRMDGFEGSPARAKGLVREGTNHVNERYFLLAIFYPANAEGLSFKGFNLK